MSVDTPELTARTEEEPVEPPRRSRRRRSTRHGPVGGQVVTMTVLFVAGIYFVTPIYWVLVSSTKNVSGLFNSFGLWFKHPQLAKNLSDTFSYSDHIFLRWLGNSVVYAGGGALVATYLAAAAGFAMAKYDFPGKDKLFALILAGVMVPGTALALPLYFMASKVGLLDTYWSVLLPSFVSPFGVYLMRVYATSAVPNGLIEAARIDGASEVRIFHSVALKIMTPALVTVFLFQFVAIWNNFFLPLVMLSKERLFPVTLGLSLWNSQTDKVPQLYVLTVTGTAVSVVALVIAILSLQRFWRSGLTVGAIK